jgi:hypothetical protein
MVLTTRARPSRKWTGVQRRLNGTFAHTTTRVIEQQVTIRHHCPTYYA